MKKIIIVLLAIVVVALGFYFIRTWHANRLYRNKALCCGNGRIEATEINIAAKLAGKVEKVNVKEGDLVEAGQDLVVMQTNVLEANLAQAKAGLQQAIAAEASAKAQVGVKQATLDSARASLVKIKAEAEFAQTQFKRYKDLLEKDAATKQHYDSAETDWKSKLAEVSSQEAVVKESEANLNVAKAELEGAKANIEAAKADIASVQADIDDSYLKAPLKGRIQYRIAEPGEVLSAGGRALNMVDLTDVYMTFFLPEEQAGQVKIGADARIILDAYPDFPLRAKVSYVASVAQFTPKTVETRVERQKLMFRIKAHLNPEILKEHLDMVMTGLPGVTWVRLDDNEPWPEELKNIYDKQGAAAPEAPKAAEAKAGEAK